GERARARVAEHTGSDALRLMLCDLSDLDSVERLAAELHEQIDSLDAVIHNAGALLQTREHSPQGYELTLAVHVLGPFLLSHRLAPLLGEARSGQGKLIFVSSGGAYTSRLDPDDLELERRQFDGPEFYAHAKRAQIALLPELNRRLGDGIRADGMHPGWAATPGVADSLPRFNRLLGPLLRSPEQGADTIVWLAARNPSPEDEGSLWMDRRPRPEHRVPWTTEEPGERARLYETCAELTGLGAEDQWEASHRGPTGAVRAHPSP
ncbi:MAG TPA: SDR family oxidoreductase, partial [Solirubrobacterales bacterium]|nr:SDR family oxidoreductase [Solirubrobacterales bacterium]